MYEAASHLPHGRVRTRPLRPDDTNSLNGSAFLFSAEAQPTHNVSQLT